MTKMRERDGGEREKKRVSERAQECASETQG